MAWATEGVRCGCRLVKVPGLNFDRAFVSCQKHDDLALPILARTAVEARDHA